MCVSQKTGMKARFTHPFLSFASNTYTLYMQNIVFILQKNHINPSKLYFEFNNPWLPLLIFSFNRKRMYLQLVSQSSTGKTHERGTIKAGGSYEDFLIEGCCLQESYWITGSYWLNWNNHFESFTVSIMT